MTITVCGVACTVDHDDGSGDGSSLGCRGTLGIIKTWTVPPNRSDRSLLDMIQELPASVAWVAPSPACKNCRHACAAEARGLAVSSIHSRARNVD